MTDYRGPVTLTVDGTDYHGTTTQLRKFTSGEWHGNFTLADTQPDVFQPSGGHEPPIVGTVTVAVADGGTGVPSPVFIPETVNTGDGVYLEFGGTGDPAVPPF